MNKEIQWLLNEKYNGRLSKKAEADIKRINKGEPVDYVIGFSEFLGCKIDLSKRPLIPRPETEFWVKDVIKQIGDKKVKVLDIFSGSGCVGIAVLKHSKNAMVDFAEKDKRFIEQIRTNLKLNKADRGSYKVFQSDIFNNVKGKYDYILANPPYIPTARRNKVKPSVLKFEPKNALFAGKDGLIYIKQFLGQARKFLNIEGTIYMEFDSLQKKEISNVLEKLRYSGYRFFKDQFGRWRYVVISKVSAKIS
ncbi:MAG: peptide chain release factor N(5)-glutamine methyltransferase [Candidatus Staskawiczbacteria bacterium]